jgi:hypothetical protein
MDRQFGPLSTHRARGNVIAHPTSEAAVEFSIDKRVKVATVAEMVEAHHAGGNPTSTRMLPTE